MNKILYEINGEEWEVSYFSQNDVVTVEEAISFLECNGIAGASNIRVI